MNRTTSLEPTRMPCSGVPSPNGINAKAPSAIFALLLLILLAAGLGGCGVRYYSATVTGYVRESKAAANGTVAGINGAEVLIYLEDPAVNPAAVPSIRTSSMTSGNNDGYWSHKVMWTSSAPAFADAGDSGTVWVKTMRKGYFPATVKVPGILSDSSNVVPTIELTKIITTSLKGLVVNKDGVGVNGVNVVLDLMSTTANKADYSATTATVNGVVGVFTFADIAWEDPDSVPPAAKSAESRVISGTAATEDVKIYIDDPNYYSDANSADERYTVNQAAFAITSGEEIVNRMASPITVYSANFTAPLVKGRVVTAAGAGLNKVTMALLFPVIGGNPVTVTTANLGGADGWYQFDGTKAVWTNNRPTHSALGLHDDVVTARAYVNDGNFYSTNDGNHPLEVTVTSDQTLTIPTDIKAGDARFKSPSVKGRVIFNNSLNTAQNEGINGVQVTLELASNSQNPQTTQTATISATDGTFEFTNVTWIDTNPPLDAGGNVVGETEQARIYINDTNYNSDTVQTSPRIVVISAGVGLDLVSSPVQVTKRAYSCPKISGTVVKASDHSTGIAGITVVLHRQADATTTNDLSATTDKNGIYVFNNVQWTDATPSAAKTDSLAIKLSTQSTDYSTSVPLGIQTIDSDAAKTVTAIEATRTTGWSYQVTLTGKAVFRSVTANSTTDVPLSGVTVSIQFKNTSPNNDGNLVTNTAPLVVNTDNNGNYTATVTWSRDPNYSPAPDAAANGGDKLNVDVTFSDATNGTKASNKDLLSWSQNNSVSCVYP
jgi:hypothetical protein